MLGNPKIARLLRGKVRVEIEPYWVADFWKGKILKSLLDK